MELLHIFRNTPFGRETLFQSLDFCRRFEMKLCVYIPRNQRFLMYFDNEAVEIHLDESYLRAPETASKHLEEIVEDSGVEWEVVTPPTQTNRMLPNLRTTYSLMCAPRILSEPSSGIGLGKIGPKVRKLVLAAPFPLLIPSAVYQPWESATVFYGGSRTSVKCLELGLDMARAGIPLEVFSVLEDGVLREDLEAQIAERGLLDLFAEHVSNWHLVEGGNLEEELYAVSRRSLLLLGAYGRGRIKAKLFGSTMETIHRTMPNNLLILGPVAEANRLIPVAEDRLAKHLRD